MTKSDPDYSDTFRIGTLLRMARLLERSSQQAVSTQSGSAASSTSCNSADDMRNKISKEVVDNAASEHVKQFALRNMNRGVRNWMVSPSLHPLIPLRNLLSFARAGDENRRHEQEDGGGGPGLALGR